MTAARSARCDVVIAGGSYAGLAFGLALARAAGPDLAVTVLDRAAFDGGALAPDPRAFALADASRALLEALGVWPELAPHAQPVLAVDITDSALGDAVRPVLLATDTVVDERVQMHILEAWRLKSALLRGVRAEPSVELLAPVEIQGMERDDSGVRLLLAGGDGIEARLAVAADGARSSLRTAAGIGVVGGSYDQLGIVAIVGHELPHEARAVQHFLPAGPFALLPLPGRRCCITWSETTGRGREIMALDDRAFLDEVERRAGHRLGRLWLEGPRAAWPLRSQTARSLVGPRLALIGDAARSVHPIAGQGVNLGFRDVAALAEAVVDGLRLGLDPSDATLLDRYQRWRRFDGVQSSAAYGALNALFSNDWAVLRGIRDVGVELVDRLPGLKRSLVAEAAGLTGELPRLLKGEPL